MIRAAPPCAFAALVLLAPAAVPGQSPPPPHPPANEINVDTASLRFLDKVVARVSTIDAPVGETVRIGTLQVIVRACVTRPPEETPESAAFLDVWEVKPGEPAGEVFRGWMFASSPALSAMEHPVYDLWLLECANIAAAGKSSSPRKATSR